MKHAIVFALLLSTACATGRGVQDVPQDPPRPGSAAKVPPAQEPFEVPSYAELMGTRRKKPGQGAWGDRWLVQADVLPMSFVEVQQGEDAVDAGEGTWCDGPGWQLRLAGGNLDQSLGFSYQGMSLDGDRGSLDLHAVYFDADVRVPLEEGGGSMFLTGAAGIGAVMADPDDFDPQWDAELAGQVRLTLDVDVARWMSLGFGGGLVAYGHPGDTAGYGGFFLLGATIVF
ncbi:MAG: hypothetical protein RIT25_421 [Planctomycetota bacterium]